jgi:hypothetical protein
MHFKTLSMHVIMHFSVNTYYLMHQWFHYIADENIFNSCRYVVWDKRCYLLDMSLFRDVELASRYRLTREP